MNKAEAVKVLLEALQKRVVISTRGGCGIKCPFLTVTERSSWECIAFGMDIVEGPTYRQERCDECKKLVKS